MRALSESGLSHLSSLRRWSLHHERAPESAIFEDIKERLEDAIAILELWVQEHPAAMQQFRQPVYTSHESLLLPYEAALTRHVDEHSGYFNLGSHFLWLGERTRDPEGAHAEYLRGISNPIGIKVGPTMAPEELVQLIRHLNPANEWGRITLITRFGASLVGDLLPALLSAVRNAGLCVTWSCDPMHGNIVRMSDGVKTRYFDSIMSEVLVSQNIHHDMGSWLGGLHLEITAEDVTECVGGDVGVSESHLSLNYQSYCDPRLNYGQSLELMLRFCDSFKNLVQREVGSAGSSQQIRPSDAFLDTDL
jgi:3-deoxy-7-phosphoheptulonate synthase